MNTIKSILLTYLFFVGVAVAAPTEVDNRVEYTTSLNAMASVLMNWYGSLISTKEPVSFSVVDSEWNGYRSRYPDNIIQINITNTDLVKLGADQYKFNVKSQITYKNGGMEQSQLLSETFVFQVVLLSQAVIKNVSRDRLEEAKTTSTTEFNRSYYKAREFAYAWLAYLDGINTIDVINGKQWLKQAKYSMKIGGEEVEGSIASILTKRKQYLTTGGHLLRSLDMTNLKDKPDFFMLDLIIEWKGINSEGKPVLAKIHQEIIYQLQDNNEWDVKSIKEQHLIPDIAPWQNILC